ncbi:MAG: hypothetical protein KGR19_05995 [Acidobacteria bacterium]|nr:hypothetical protein [Acidobacteriota bacterium]
MQSSVIKARPAFPRTVLLAVLVACLAPAFTASSASAATACNGYADLCDRPFNETVFVGTHNSMAADDYGWNAAVTTQTHTISEQLRRGVRALSLDVWYGKKDWLGVSNENGPTRSGIEPYLCHTHCRLGALRLESGFREVASFLNANPNEVLAIYFEDYVSVQDIRAVVESSGLMPFVHSGPLTQTLGQMIASGKRVVLISQNVSEANQTGWYPRLTSVGRDTDYDFNTTSKLTDQANLARSCQPTPWGASGKGRFFVMQHFVTNLIASRSSSRTVNAKDVLVRRALACREARGVLPSILLVDYYELGDVFGAARALNDLYEPPAPGTPTDGSGGGGAGGGDAGPGNGGNGEASGPVGALRISAFARSVKRGRAAQLSVELYNRSTQARTFTVKLQGGRGDGLSYRPTLKVRVPAQSTQEAQFVVRARRDASRGTVRLIATHGKLSSRISLVVR